MEGRLGRVEGRLEGVMGRLGGVEGRLGGVERADCKHTSLSDGDTDSW